MLNSEKIKPVVLVIIKLHLPEGIRQLVSRKFQLKKQTKTIYSERLGLYLRHFWAWLYLTNTTNMPVWYCQAGFWVITVKPKPL